MKVHVGSFWSNVAFDCRKFSIARSMPGSINLPVLSDLAPGSMLLASYKSGKTDWEGYKKRYYAELHSMLYIKGIKIGSLSEKLVEYFKQIESQYGYKEFMLCCWERRKGVEERATKPCHRDIIYALLPDDVKGESID